MDIALHLKGEELYSALLEMQVRTLAMQNAIASFLCDKQSTSDEESDALFQGVIDECNEYAKKILQDLYERRGHIDVDDILGKK